jgi:hypothetical protein
VVANGHPFDTARLALAFAADAVALVVPVMAVVNC